MTRQYGENTAQCHVTWVYWVNCTQTCERVMLVICPPSNTLVLCGFFSCAACGITVLTWAPYRGTIFLDMWKGIWSLTVGVFVWQPPPSYSTPDNCYQGWRSLANGVRWGKEGWRLNWSFTSIDADICINNYKTNYLFWW